MPIARCGVVSFLVVRTHGWVTEDRMIRVFLSLLAFLVAGVAHADGPAVVRRYTSSTPIPTVRSYAYTTSTAQGVAEMQASRGYMGHCGGNSGYEGVGMGSTPDQALNNCCYSRSGMRVVDQGVARGRDGRWYACKRYR